MENNLKIFEHPEFGTVRALEIDGEPWFIGKDVAAALEYKNPQDALMSHVSSEDKRILQKSENPALTSQIPNRGLTIINQDGLYSLIYISKRSFAKSFKSWIDHDVLPALQGYNNSVKSDDITSKTDLMLPDTNKKGKIKIFENAEFGEIRTIFINGEPWFVGKDVATALGYKDTDKALRNHVRPHHKLTRRFSGSGQGRDMIVINESGLYTLMLSSKLPSAVKFQDWVTDEVLPSIRKYGAYVLERELFKLTRRPLTDAIQASFPGDRWSFKNFTDLIYKSVLGKSAAQIRKERGVAKTATAVDFLTAEELQDVTKRQNQVAVLVGMDMNYQQIKAFLMERKMLNIPH